MKGGFALGAAILPTTLNALGSLMMESLYALFAEPNLPTSVAANRHSIGYALMSLIKKPSSVLAAETQLKQ
jgi:hypothetical protein